MRPERMIVGRPDVYQANGRPQFDCHAGLYIVINGVGDAVGREFENPYHLSVSNRAILCWFWNSALRRTAVFGLSYRSSCCL